MAREVQTEQQVTHQSASLQLKQANARSLQQVLDKHRKTAKEQLCPVHNEPKYPLTLARLTYRHLQADDSDSDARQGDGVVGQQ